MNTYNVFTLSCVMHTQSFFVLIVRALCLLLPHHGIVILYNNMQWFHGALLYKIAKVINEVHPDQ